MASQHPPNGNKVSNVGPVQDAVRVLRAVEHAHSSAVKPESKTTNWLNGLNSAGGLGESNGVDVLLEGVRSLPDALPSLAKALDQVAQLHPFVASEYPLILG